MKTGLITSDTSQNHDTGPGHPEQIARVSVIVENFKKLNNKNLIWKKPSKVSDDILLTTHKKDYINFVKNSSSKVSCLAMYSYKCSCALFRTKLITIVNT